MFDPESPPELAVARWMNIASPLTLADLKGRVVVLYAVHFLCRGSVEHALPQARRLAGRLNPEQVAVLGLLAGHGHLPQLSDVGLETLVDEHELSFPVAVDAPRGAGPSQTFAAYEMQGTPTVLVFDREGRLRRHYYGRPDDIMLAAEIMALAIEDKGAPRAEAARVERKIAAILASGGHDHGEGHDGDHHHHHGHEHGDACGCDDHDHHHAPGHPAHGPAAGAAGDARLVEAERMTEPPRDIPRR
jgi:hypothetical protein